MLARSIREKLSRQTPNLEHLPGDFGLPWVGHTFQILSNPYQLIESHYQQYGPVSKFGLTLQHGVMALGPDILQEIMLDPNRCFSAKMGYDDSLGKLFKGGLLLRDFDDHRMHRRLMQTAFKNDVMKSYVDDINPIVEKHVNSWQFDSDFHVFDGMKELTLSVAAQIFIGQSLGTNSEEVKIGFLNLMAGAVALLHVDIPGLGLAFHQGMDGRRSLMKYFKALVAEKRGSQGHDIMTYLSNEHDDQGRYFSAEEIAQHMIFLMLAAHDTTTSVLTMATALLASYPEEQSKSRDAVYNLGRDNLSWDDLEGLDFLDNLFKETMRLYPPVFSLMRRTVKDCQLAGVDLPQNTTVLASTSFVHRMEEWWSNPNEFDPSRFSSERAEHKQHPFIWVPFGGGAHKCIGMHFAGMLFKVIMFELLKKYQFELPHLYRPPVQYMPFPKIEDNLPLELNKLKHLH